MTYEASEDSVRDGFPVELYKFVIETNNYTYTSQEDEIVDGLDVYEATEIQRGELSFTGEVNKSDIKISLKRNLPIALQFLSQPPPVPVLLYIYRYHRTDGIGNKVVIWSGRVLNVTWSGAIATMTCENTYTSINRFGLQRTYGAGCPLTLYKSGHGECNVSSNNYRLTDTVTDLTGNVVTAAGLASEPNGYYNGGYVIYLASGEPSQYRSIIDHTGDTVTLSYSIPGLAAGAELQFLPGCGQDLDDCEHKFNNKDNYGGFAYNPLVVPFNGTSLF